MGGRRLKAPPTLEGVLVSCGPAVWAGRVLVRVVLGLPCARWLQTCRRLGCRKDPKRGLDEPRDAVTHRGHTGYQGSGPEGVSWDTATLWHMTPLQLSRAREHVLAPQHVLEPAPSASVRLGLR